MGRIRLTYDEFIKKVINTKNDHPEWRLGQTYFNVLWDVNRDLALDVYMGEADPFYFDNRIPAFLGAVHSYFEAFGSVTDERRSS